MSRIAVLLVSALAWPATASPQFLDPIDARMSYRILLQTCLQGSQCVRSTVAQSLALLPLRHISREGQQVRGNLLASLMRPLPLPMRAEVICGFRQSIRCKLFLFLGAPIEAEFDLTELIEVQTCVGYNYDQFQTPGHMVYRRGLLETYTMIVQVAAPGVQLTQLDYSPEPQRHGQSQSQSF